MPYRRPTTNGASGVEWSPRDMLMPYVLLAISLQRAHGYMIEEYLRNLGLFRIDASTLYRTLRQMEKDGLLSSEWESGESGPARRVYSITDAGLAWLDAWSATLEAYRGMIDNFFALYTGRRPVQQPGGAHDESVPEEE
jgi:poly-beta-hydroxybutyrate-responsive repressor